MKLLGYIEAYKELMFTIPVYTDNGEYFFHEVDTSYKISGFNKFNESNFSEKLIIITTNFEFKKGNFGAIVFKGEEDDLIYDRFENGINRVKRYLSIKTKDHQFLNVKEDVFFFESLIPKKIVYWSQKTPPKNIAISSDVQYVLNYLNQNSKSGLDLGDLISALYDKVLKSDNKEKAIAEFKKDFGKVKPATIGVILPRQIGRAKLIRKRASSKRSSYRNTKDLNSKVVFLKAIIEEIEKKHIKKFIE